MRLVENWLNGQTPRVVTSDTKSSRRPLLEWCTAGVLTASSPFNISSSDLEDGADYTLSKSADDINFGQVTDRPESHAAILNDLHRLENTGGCL